MKYSYTHTKSNASSMRQYKLQRSDTHFNIFKHDFMNICLFVWNKLPEDVFMSHTLQNFHNKIQHLDFSHALRGAFTHNLPPQFDVIPFSFSYHKFFTTPQYTLFILVCLISHRKSQISKFSCRTCWIIRHPG